MSWVKYFCLTVDEWSVVNESLPEEKESGKSYRGAMTMKKKILFFDTKPYDQQFFDRANQAAGFEIKYVKSRLNPDTAVMAEGCDALCAFVNDDLSAATAERLQATGLRAVALRCAGYNNVDLKTFYGNIHVMRVPAYSPHAVAEHAMALILSLNRKTHRAYYRTRDNNFAINGLLGFDLFGKTAGIIGTGKIGRITAEILRGFGMRVLAHDPFPDAEWAQKSGVEYLPLTDLYAQAHILTLHCPLTAENHHLINAEALAAMRDGVMIINTGRGALIDTPALVEALKSHKVGSAGLDVYEEEDQYFFEDFSNEVLDDDVLARLLGFPNVLVTAHQAFFTEEALTGIAETTLENLRQFFAGEPLVNEICYQCCDKPCRKKEEGRCFE